MIKVGRAWIVSVQCWAEWGVGWARRWAGGRTGGAGPRAASHGAARHPADTPPLPAQGEIDAKTTEKSGSATDALRWLKRALTFMRIFLTDLAEAEKPSPSAAASKACVPCRARPSTRLCALRRVPRHRMLRCLAAAPLPQRPRCATAAAPALLFAPALSTLLGLLLYLVDTRAR